MSFKTKKISLDQLELLGRITAKGTDLSSFASGEFTSAAACMEAAMALREAVNKQIHDNDRVTAREDRDSVGDPRKNTDKGKLYWALSAIASEAYYENNRLNPPQPPKDENLEITQEQRAAIETVVEFLRANHNGSNSLQNPNAFANGGTFTELRNIAEAGRVGLNTTMSREEVLLLSDAIISLKATGKYDVLDSNKIPSDIKASANIAAEALASVRMNAGIKNVTFVEKELEIPGAEATHSAGTQAGRQASHIKHRS